MADKPKDDAKDAKAAAPAAAAPAGATPSTELTADGKPKEFKDEKGQPMMAVKIYSPFKTYFNEPAYSITAENDTGPFDILPHHHNFMTLVNPCDLQIQTQRGLVKIRIARGVMHIKSDSVILFLDV